MLEEAGEVGRVGGRASEKVGERKKVGKSRENANEKAGERRGETGKERVGKD